MAGFSKAALTQGVTQYFENANFAVGHRPISKKNIANEQFLRKLEFYTRLLYQNSRLRIHTIANHMAVCERQLCRKTKKTLGLTPGQYLKKFRLNQAKRLLSDGMPISRVSGEVGFSSYHYFAKCFKDEFGYTASSFVKQWNGLNDPQD